MASFSCVFVFVACLFAVEAFPNARRSGPEKAFVLYRMPSRCTDAPEKNICDIGYKIQYLGDNKFSDLVSSFGPLKNMLQTLGISDECIEKNMKLWCRKAFPECLPDGELDYGDQHGLIDQIHQECGLTFRKANFTTGTVKDPHASAFVLKCTDLPQDPMKKCPKPKYKVPERQKDEYYKAIQNVSEEMDKDKKDIPQECRQKAFNVFACSYAFCSSDGKALLMQTSREDCEEIAKCLERNEAADEEAMEFLDETCPKYPSSDKNEIVDLPY